MQSDPTVQLDTRLLVWVLFPIVAVMLLAGMLRHHGSRLLHRSPRTDLQQTRAVSVLERVRVLAADRTVSPQSHCARIAAMHACLALPQSPPQMADVAQMLAGSMAMYVPQTLLMAWVSHFFAGFVVTRLPFPLTLRFKAMIQKGIDTDALNVRYVSSLSWYFLNLFGLNAVYSLVLPQSRTPPQQPLHQNTDVALQCRAAAEAMLLVDYKWALLGIETRTLQRFAPPSTQATKKTH